MTTNFNRFDHHSVFGILVDYEDRLDNNRMAAQMDDIHELQRLLTLELVLDPATGSLVDPGYENFEVTDAQREILSRAFDQRALKIEREAKLQLELLDGLRSRI